MFASDGRAFAKWLETSENRVISESEADKLQMPESSVVYWSWCQAATQTLANDLVREYNLRLQSQLP